jgi:hypothetical protein
LSDTNEQWVISFGKGVRLMSEEYYMKELRPFGLGTRRAFRSLCRSIGVPIVFIGSVGFVDPSVFQVCMKNLSVPGSKDFLCPNSTQKVNGQKNARNRIDPDDILYNWRYVVRSIIDARRMNGLHSPPAERAAIKSAAAELARFVLTMIPSGQQEQANNGNGK